MNQNTLKLNYKNKFKFAFAFFGILMLWQAYNFYCPLILKALLLEKGIENNNFIVGVIMALDNVVAILIMPLVGKWSDKTNTKWGKRMPYIIIGMALTAIVFPFIALMCMWNSLAGVIIFMMLFLIIMQGYRSPAVAFMPDITPKPLRATANGIINLVGYLGGVFVTILGMIPAFKLNSTSTLPQIQNAVLWPFVICTIVFVIVLLYLLFSINEKRLLEQTKSDVLAGEKLAETTEEIKEDNVLSKTDKKNFIIILIAIFFWFMSFNSFETFGSTFGKEVLNDTGVISTMSMLLSVTSILSFVLFSSLSNKIGRKMTIIIGLAFLVFALVLLSIVTLTVNFDEGAGTWKIFFYIMAVLMGIGWALININSFPMVVEFSNKNNLGKFTSYYYIASMLAQSITPILVGLIMDDPFRIDPNHLGLKVLFLYAAILMIIALVIFIFIKEKITISDRRKNVSKKSALENLGDIDS